MLEVIKGTVLILSALFPIVNPLGTSPIFLAMTADYPSAARAALSRRVAWNSFVLLVASFLIGTHVLAFFGISLPVVQVGGGLIVISTGWSMLKQRDEDPPVTGAKRTLNTRDIFRNAFYPLTLPLTVGPGSISVAITLGANEPRHVGLNILGLIAPILGSFLIGVSVLLCYGFAHRLARLLGPTGMSIMMRLSSFLLVCIGVQILWNGVHGLLSTLPGLAR